MTEFSRVLTADEAKITQLLKRYKQLEAFMDGFCGDESDAGYILLAAEWQMTATEIGEFNATSLLCCQVKFEFVYFYERFGKLVKESPASAAFRDAVTQMREFSGQIQNQLGN